MTTANKWTSPDWGHAEWGHGRGHDVGCEWTKPLHDIDLSAPCQCRNRRWLQLDIDNKRFKRGVAL